MKRIIFILIMLPLAYMNTGCKGMVAGFVNNTLINKESDQWVNGKLAKVAPLNLTEQQKEMATKIYTDEIMALKENARKAKTGEIKNKASIHTVSGNFTKQNVEHKKI